jgi:hypothetical protein
MINPCILFTNPFSLLNNWFPMICVNRPHSVISLVIRSLKLTFRSFTLLVRFHALLIQEGEALRCKIGPTFYLKIMLDIE